MQLFKKDYGCMGQFLEASIERSPKEVGLLTVILFPKG